MLSNAGFECAAVLDRLYGLRAGAALSEANPDAAAGDACPAIAHADNPVDTTPMATTAQFVAAAAALLEDPGVDALLVSPIPVTPTLDDLAPDLVGSHSENIYAPGSLPQELLRLFRQTRKPMAAVRGLGPSLRRLRGHPPARRHPGVSEDRPGLPGALRLLHRLSDASPRLFAPLVAARIYDGAIRGAGKVCANIPKPASQLLQKTRHARVPPLQA